MGKTEYAKKIKAARRTGRAAMPDGSTLIMRGSYWSVRDKTGQTVDTANSPEQLYYLFK